MEIFVCGDEWLHRRSEKTRGRFWLEMLDSWVLCKQFRPNEPRFSFRNEMNTAESSPFNKVNRPCKAGKIVQMYPYNCYVCTVHGSGGGIRWKFRCRSAKRDKTARVKARVSTKTKGEESAGDYFENNSQQYPTRTFLLYKNPTFHTWHDVIKYWKRYTKILTFDKILLSTNTFTIVAKHASRLFQVHLPKRSTWLFRYLHFYVWTNCN